MQDAWHYFDSVLGGGTFSREGQSLKGRVELYESGRRRAFEALEASSLGSEDDEVYDEIDSLLSIDEIEDEAHLKQASKRGRALVEKLGRALNIDARSGETPEVFETPRTNARRRN
jgi:hypothetical protein